MAIDLLAAIKQVAIPKTVGKDYIQIRIGIHTGKWWIVKLMGPL